jgi:hypothetical protein
VAVAGSAAGASVAGASATFDWPPQLASKSMSKRIVKTVRIFCVFIVCISS